MVVAFVGAMRIAVAQPSSPSAPAASMQAPPAPAQEPRSAGVGVTLALVGTILPAVGFGVGWSLDDDAAGTKLIVGSVAAGLFLPSLGMYYGGEKQTIGQYPRAAAVLTLVIGLLADGLGDGENAGAWYGATAALYGLGSVIDLAMTPGAVRDWNDQYARPAVAVAPATFSGGGVGVALGGSL